MSTYLDSIVAAHRAAAAADRRALDSLLEKASAAAPTRSLASALRGAQLGVIAEIKRRSPSRGGLAEGLDPTEVALEYEAGGAAAISVLTDGAHFGGSAEDLEAARRAVALPILRKDFTVDERDVADARLMGADAVLLIAAVLDDAELRAFSSLASELDLDALVEVHDEAELERALDCGAILIGVNQRDLVTFEVDTSRALGLVDRIPAGVVAVAESGIRSAEDAGLLAAAGYDAVLVGESLVTSMHRSGAVRSLADLRVGEGSRI